MNKKLLITILILLVSSLLLGCSSSSDATGEIENQDNNNNNNDDDNNDDDSNKLNSFNGRIVAMGDSLTEGLGVDETDAYPAILQKKLLEDGYQFEVINTGISGETSSGALSRIDWVLKLKPDIVILETGANDGLRGIDVSVTTENIDAIITHLKENNVVVVFTGMEMIQNLGSEYTTAFEALYPQIAQEHDIIFMPFFLGDVAGIAQLNQNDGIHPTEEGYEIIVDNLYPYVLDAIETYEREK